MVYLNSIKLITFLTGYHVIIINANAKWILCTNSLYHEEKTFMSV